MKGKVVVGYNGTDEARDAVTLGEELAEAIGADLTLACVVP